MNPLSHQERLARTRTRLEAIRTKLAVEAEREKFLQYLKTDTRPETRYTEAQPDKGRRDAALATVAAAASDLGIPIPTVKWFRPAQAGEDVAFEFSPINGKASRETVWLSTTIPVSRLIVTAAHETAHCAGRDEIDAQIYGDRFAIERTGR